MTTIFSRWEELVGAAVAAHVQPVVLEGTTDSLIEPATQGV